LIADGHDVTVIQPGEVTRLGGVIRGGQLIESFSPPDADVIVLQRPSSKYLAQAVPLLRAKGIAVVVDVDDDLAHIHPANPAFRMLHPKWNPDNNWAHVAYACRHATLVTVSTAGLVARYGSHGRARVLDNYVPRHYLDAPRETSPSPQVGWAGSLHSHPDDFRQAAGTLARHARAGGNVTIIGSDDGISRELHGAPFTATGIVEFDAWPTAVARLDVGVAPLADTVFNRSKSRWKPLEYSACGVAWVASDLPEYRRLADLGAGVVVRRERDWWREVHALASDEGLRFDRAQRAREVAASLTVEEHAWRWVDAWEAAHAIEHPRTVVV